jgi:hypothetical protein
MQKVSTMDTTTRRVRRQWLTVLAIVAVASTGCVRMREDAAAARSVSLAQVATTGTPEAAAANAIATETPLPVPSATAQPEATTAPSATAAPSPSPAASPSAAAGSPTAAADETPLVLTFKGGPGGTNKVQIINKTGGRLRVEGNADYGHAKGKRVEPLNSAIAYASCTDCQTFAIALQLVLYREGATIVAPHNQALAINVQCTRCVTVARAVQYVLPVPDPNDPPENVKRLVKRIDEELTGIERDQASLKVDQAESRIDAVIGEFTELGDRLNQQRDVKTEPTTGDLPASP